MPGPLLSGQWASAIADHGPLTEAAVNELRLGVHEQEQGRVASVLGLPPLFPFSSPQECLRAGGHLTFHKHRNSTGHGRALCQGLGTIIDTTGGRNACFRERDDDKKIVFTSIK